MVLAYEVFCRLCDAVSVRQRSFDHVTVGIMASTAAAAKAMGLSAEETYQALNLSIAANNALYQTRIGDVSLWKGCAFANASRNAVFAVQLAAKGLTGPSPIFEGPGGFFSAVSGGPFALEPFGGKGGDFKIMDCTIKRFPLGLYSQTVVQAALEARQQLARVEDIQEVHIKTLQTAVNIMAGDAEKWHPTNRETADHSMPYTTAVALMYGTVEPRHFGAEYWRDPRLLALTQRVKVRRSSAPSRRIG
jgi:2-methylcitrate dehydratase